MNAVYCTSAMSIFGRAVASALDWPLFIDTYTGHVATVYIVGMYDPPHYGTTFRNTRDAKRRIIHWCGSDTKWADAENIPRDITHVANFQAYADRLRDRDIDAPVLHLPTCIQFDKPLPLPDEPVVLMYGGGNPAIYGAGLIDGLAECLPDVKFLIKPLGSEDVGHMRELYSKCSLSVQPAHTGGGSTSREMMAAGRNAITTIGGLKHAKLVFEQDFPGLLLAVQESLETPPDPAAGEYWREANRPETFAAKVGAL